MRGLTKDSFLCTGVSLTTLYIVHKLGDFKVEYLREFEDISKKDVTRVSVAQEKLFYEKTEVENL
jgi:hypothetical protein